MNESGVIWHAHIAQWFTEKKNLVWCSPLNEKLAWQTLWEWWRTDLNQRLIINKMENRYTCNGQDGSKSQDSGPLGVATMESRAMESKTTENRSTERRRAEMRRAEMRRAERGRAGRRRAERRSRIEENKTTRSKTTESKTRSRTT